MLSLEEKLRAGHVRRWHIVAVAREQTIAEHMYRVQLITEALLRTIGLFNWDRSLTLNAMEWARVHDLPEVKLGDTPSNGKHLLHENGGKAAMVAAERQIDADIADLHECVSADGECPLAGLIVKVADLAEAANFCGIYGVGDHARRVYHGLRAQTFDALEKLIGYEDFLEKNRYALVQLVTSITDSRPA